MPSIALSVKDANTHMSDEKHADGAVKGDVKSMEYHRQMLQSKMAEDKSQTYISPSDNIMSPCTAKLNALRNKQIGKAKPRSLFAQTSSKKLEGNNIFGARNPSPPKTSESS